MALTKKNRALPSQGQEKKGIDESINPDLINLTNDEEYIGHLASIVESSDDAIISKSLDGIIKSWNRGSEKVFGYSAEEVVGKHISLIVPPEYINEEKRIVQRIANNEIIDNYETIRNKKGGEQFHVSLTVSPLKDRTGKIVGVSKIARDITARKKSEKELAFQNEEKEKRANELIVANKELAFQNGEKEKRANELIVANKELAFQNEEKGKRANELIVANKELESFSYSVSHDLRAPLRAILGYAQMLKANEENKMGPEANRLMNNIVNNTKKMGQLIDDLLTFSRLGRKELVKITVSMDDLVRSICNEFKNEQHSRDIEFHIKPLLSAPADAIAIKQVWLNLISNAVKYSKLKAKTIIEIDSEMKGDEIIYSIKDNGAGFDMRYANKLFGVFQRLHSDEEFEGTGVGLAIVQRIIIKHGGRLWAESTVNEGASFFFTLNKS